MLAAGFAVAILAACSGGSSVPVPSVPVRTAQSLVEHGMPMRNRLPVMSIGTTIGPHSLLGYHSYYVETNPLVYVVFWGWKSDPYQEASRLIGFLNHVGGSGWLATVTQYYDDDPAIGRTFIQNPTHLLKGWWYDNLDPIPGTPDGQAIAQEVQNASNHLGLNSSEIVLIALPQGHGNYIFLDKQWCGYHSSTITRIPFIALPYSSDGLWNQCSATYQYPNADVSVTGGHELAEAITDPFPNGWYYYDPAQPAGEQDVEIGDLCESYHWSFVTLRGESFQMQPLYSDNAGQCWTTTGVGPSTY